jgi:hypothetical protein
MRATRVVRSVYIYACATLSGFNEAATRFNLRQVRRAFGEEALVIVVEGQREVRLGDAEGLVDAVLHADFAPGLYYDSALYQEGVLEAFRLLGQSLEGVELLVLANDSVLGPLDLNLFQKWRQGAGSELLSPAVWRGKILTGAAVAFTRGALDHTAFADYWRWADEQHKYMHTLAAHAYS